MATVTLGGKIVNARDPVVWPLVDGVSPAKAVFELSHADAKELFVAGKEIDLVIKREPASAKDTTIKRLFVLGMEPSKDPYFARVLVADIRWRWEYPILAHVFNGTRRVGHKRVTEDGGVPELDELADDVAWRGPGMKDPGARVGVWNGNDILNLILPKMPGVKSYSIAGTVASGLSKFEPEDLDLDGNASSELQRVLEYLPTAGITVDPDSSVRVFDKSGGGEVAALAALGPEYASGGHIVMVDNRWLKPSEIRIGIPILGELRYNYVEATSGASQAAIGTQRLGENVLPLPDHTTTISGKSYPQGTYATFDEAFVAWNADSPLPRGLQWSHDLLQKAMMGFIDLFAAVDVAGLLSPGDDKNPGRIDACRQHYRQTFRINPAWMDGILEIRASRVSTIGPRGQRGKSPVYSDHAKRNSERALYKSALSGGGLYYGQNYDGLASTQDIIGTDTKRAPCILTIDDPEQGIVHFNYLPDMYGQVAQVFPSKVDNMPTGDFLDRDANGQWDCVRPNQDIPQLHDAFKCAFIVSATPYGPNNKNRFFWITVKPAEVRGMLTGAAADGLSQCMGPPMEMIYRGTEALVAWVDSKASEIEKLFGVGLNPASTTPPNIADLVVNYAPGSTKGGASLQSVARALAAQMWATFANRLAGEAEGNIAPDLKLDGRLSSVMHVVDTDGNCKTRIAFEPRSVKPNLLELLGPAERRAVNRARIA